MGVLYYRLDENRNPVPISHEESVNLFKPEVFEKTRQVARDENASLGVSVSTVFLVLDHAFGPGPPILFETMVFGGRHDQYCERYCTWEEAVEGHKRICEFAFAWHLVTQGKNDE